jgi:hypothetical protein
MEKNLSNYAHQDPFTITVKYYDCINQFGRDHSDITETDFMELIEKVIFSSGFCRQNLEQYIIEWGEELKDERG